MEVVINVNFGGFSLSEDAEFLLLQRVPELASEFDPTVLDYSRLKRDMWELVDLVRELGDHATDRSQLAVIEVPDDISDYEIVEYDGMETIHYVQNGKLYHIPNFMRNDPYLCGEMGE